MSKSAFIKFIVSGLFPRCANSVSRPLKRPFILLSICLVATLLAGHGFYVNRDPSDLRLSAAKPSTQTLFTDQTIPNYQLINPATPSLTSDRAVEYLKQSGMDKSLYEAVTAARYKVESEKEKLIASNHAMQFIAGPPNLSAQRLDKWPVN